MVLATEGARVASLLKAAVVARIASGYHVNNNQPNRDYLIPTELQMELPASFSVQRTVYPKGEARKFAFSNMPLLVYEDTFLVGLLLKIGKDVKPGTYQLKGKLIYQACDDHTCLPPASVVLTLPVTVVRRAAPLKPINTDVFKRINFEQP